MLANFVATSKPRNYSSPKDTSTFGSVLLSLPLPEGEGGIWPRMCSPNLRVARAPWRGSGASAGEKKI